jgi:hypothetical protein
VFGGKTFREIAAASGESIDTLTARKRYALRSLSHTLRHWIALGKNGRREANIFAGAPGGGINVGS